jgi:hypothetical protein
MVAKFEIGKTYFGRLISDADSRIELTVASRTASTIKTTDGKSFRIAKNETEWNAAETVFPMGRYSMAPVVKADRKAG